MKSLFNDNERAFGEAISKLAYCNPFLPERIEYEREALGKDFVDADARWNLKAGYYEKRPNLVKIIEQTEKLTQALRKRLIQRVKASKEELKIYEELVLFLLYHRYSEELQSFIELGVDEKVSFYGVFKRDAKSFLEIRGIAFPGQFNIPHIFAIFFQLRRAFHHIFSCIIGESKSTVKLRADVWQSIFTHNLKRYERTLYQIMGDITTLITGPSGTGKELVARAIGMSRYIPFNEKTGRFFIDFTGIFSPLNISALSPTLVESELFGHKKGAFTGAIQDRVGWLESCSPYGTIFLDEIGEVAPSIQVKLLRVLQQRSFQKLGETKELSFKGKIIAATNRDLAEEIANGNFRKDFYYRLCSDIITTPSLYDQLLNSPEELNNLVRFLVKRQAGDDAEALPKEVINWIKKELGSDYSWPGNIRELEQCIRNVMIRNEYHPPILKKAPDSKNQLAEELNSGLLTADELLSKYCKLVYSQTGSYQETARRLGLDRRTVKSRVHSNSSNQS